MAAEDGAMAYWYNLAWPCRSTTSDEAGKVERIGSLSTSYTMKKAKVKKKKKKTVAKDIYDQKILTKKKKKNKKGKKVKVPKKVRVQYVEAKLEQQVITFNTAYHVATGTLDIQSKVEEIRDMIGSSGPLVLGRTYPGTNAYPRVFGKYEMQLTKVDVSAVEFDNLGRWLKADVAFTLTQTKSKKVKKASNKFPGQSAKEVLKFWVENPDEIPKQYESAVKISPDPNVKKMWKKRKEDKKKKKKKKK